MLDVREYQLICVACMLISSKLRDIKPLSIKKCQKLCNYRFTRSRIIETESSILFALNFDLEQTHLGDQVAYNIAYIKYKLTQESLFPATYLVSHLITIENLVYQLSLVVLALDFNLNLQIQGCICVHLAIDLYLKHQTP